MPATYEPIATTTLGTANSAITFSSIPSTYTDLKLVIVYSTATGSFQPRIRYNGDTGTNYSSTYLSGNGTAASSARDTSATFIIIYKNGNLTTTLATTTIDVFSYAGSTNKTCLVSTSADKNGSGDVERSVGLWRNTAAINELQISATGNFAIGTTATLFGIKAA